MKNRVAFVATLAIVLLIMPTLAQSAKLSDRSYITGAVLNPSRAPIRSVWVIISQDNSEKGRSLTGDDGKYYISNLNEGTYDIIVMRGNSQLFKGQVYLPKDSIFNIPIK